MCLFQKTEHVPLIILSHSLALRRFALVHAIDGKTRYWPNLHYASNFFASNKVKVTPTGSSNCSLVDHEATESIGQSLALSQQSNRMQCHIQWTGSPVLVNIKILDSEMCIDSLVRFCIIMTHQAFLWSVCQTGVEYAEDRAEKEDDHSVCMHWPAGFIFD